MPGQAKTKYEKVKHFTMLNHKNFEKNAFSNGNGFFTTNCAFSISDESDADADSDSDSDDDETAALMAELQKIKREKAVDEREKEEKRKQEEEKIRMENILSGNPLLKEKYAGPSSDKSDLKVKRRWDDDVVFKNCSRAEPDKKEKTFINDSLRSDFHRKFIDRYIK